MGTNNIPFVADLFLKCYERGFMGSLAKEKRNDVIKAFNSTSIYLGPVIQSIVGQTTSLRRQLFKYMWTT